MHITILLHRELTRSLLELHMEDALPWPHDDVLIGRLEAAYERTTRKHYPGWDTTVLLTQDKIERQDNG